MQDPIFTQKNRKNCIALLDQESQLLKWAATDKWEWRLQRNLWFVEGTTFSSFRLVWDFLLGVGGRFSKFYHTVDVVVTWNSTFHFSKALFALGITSTKLPAQAGCLSNKQHLHLGLSTSTWQMQGCFDNPYLPYPLSPPSDRHKSISWGNSYTKKHK